MSNYISKVNWIPVRQFAKKCSQSHQNIYGKVGRRIKKGVMIENRDFKYKTVRHLLIREDLEL